MTLGELFAGIANAIRSKDGTTASIPATTFPERILAISVGGGGGDGSSYVVNVPVTISARVSVTAEKYYTHFLYNGARLPRIPDSVLASYPYVLIARNTSGTIRIYGSTKTTYCFVDTSDASHVKIKVQANRVRVPYDAATDAWGSAETATNATNLDITDTWEVLWSNHDIPNGSETATDIYFEGTDPVPTD